MKEDIFLFVKNNPLEWMKPSAQTDQCSEKSLLGGNPLGWISPSVRVDGARGSFLAFSFLFSEKEVTLIHADFFHGNQSLHRHHMDDHTTNLL